MSCIFAASANYCLNVSIYISLYSNHADKIDPALLRPGRLEKHVYLGYANSDEEWSDLFSKISSNRGIDDASSEYIASGKLLKEHGGNMKHLRRLSAADLKAVIDTAHLAAVHEYLDSTSNEIGTISLSGGRPQIERRHIRSHIDKAVTHTVQGMCFKHIKQSHFIVGQLE